MAEREQAAPINQRAAEDAEEEEGDAAHWARQLHYAEQEAAAARDRLDRAQRQLYQAELALRREEAQRR